jgi:hypothetical protein
MRGKVLLTHTPLTDVQTRKAELILHEYQDAVLMVRHWRTAIAGLHSRVIESDADLMPTSGHVSNPTFHKAVTLLHDQAMQLMDQRTKWVWRAYQQVDYPVRDALGWLYFNQPRLSWAQAMERMHVGRGTFFRWKAESLAQFVEHLPPSWEDPETWYGWNLLSPDDDKWESWE